MAQAVKTVPALSLIAQMAHVSKYSLTQLKYFQGREISATAKEAAIIRRQAEGMRKLADQWEQLAGGSV